MNAKLISQREARALRKRVEVLEYRESRRRNQYIADWPLGANIANIAADRAAVSAIKTARMLRHAVVVTVGGNDEICFLALPLAGDKS